MSAALQLATVWATEVIAYCECQAEPETPAKPPATSGSNHPVVEPEDIPSISLAFYRKHTEKLLRRYLYASMLVGRAPAILGEPIGRGWASSRRVKTFEDAVIFVLDIERCLDKLGAVDRAILSRIVLQEYTHGETADLLRVSLRTISHKYPLALDRLTRLLLQSNLLILPH
jgi:hypothetical protein